MKMKNFVLGLGIFIVYGLVLWQGIAAFYPGPEYADFCDENFRNFPKPIGTTVDCPVEPSDLQSKSDSCWRMDGSFRYEYDEDGCIIGGYCDECSIEYNDALDEHSRNVFIITLIIGIITFIVGFSILSVEPVGSALLASAVLAVFSGTVVNWRNFGTGIRFVLLLVVLVLLIWIAYRLNKHGKLFGKKRK